MILSFSSTVTSFGRTLALQNMKLWVIIIVLIEKNVPVHVSYTVNS